MLWLNSVDVNVGFLRFLTSYCSVLEGGRIQGTYLLLIVKDRGIMGNGKSPTCICETVS